MGSHRAPEEKFSRVANWMLLSRLAGPDTTPNAEKSRAGGARRCITLRSHHADSTGTLLVGRYQRRIRARLSNRRWDRADAGRYAARQGRHAGPQRAPGARQETAGCEAH